MVFHGAVTISHVCRAIACAPGPRHSARVARPVVFEDHAKQGGRVPGITAVVRVLVIVGRWQRLAGFLSELAGFRAEGASESRTERCNRELQRRTTTSARLRGPGYEESENRGCHAQPAMDEVRDAEAKVRLRAAHAMKYEWRVRTFHLHQDSRSRNNAAATGNVGMNGNEEQHARWDGVKTMVSRDPCGAQPAAAKATAPGDTRHENNTLITSIADPKRS